MSLLFHLRVVLSRAVRSANSFSSLNSFIWHTATRWPILQTRNYYFPVLFITLLLSLVVAGPESYAIWAANPAMVQSQETGWTPLDNQSYLTLQCFNRVQGNFTRVPDVSHTRIAPWEEQVGLFMTVVPSVADILKFLVRHKYWKFLHSLKIYSLGPVRYHKIHLLVLDQLGKDWIKISWPVCGPFPMCWKLTIVMKKQFHFKSRIAWWNLYGRYSLWSVYEKSECDKSIQANVWQLYRIERQQQH